MIRQCDYYKCNYVLVGVDECGDEFYADWWIVEGDLDEDFFDLWQDIKLHNARERWPEARRFYFEDRRGWHNMRGVFF